MGAELCLAHDMGGVEAYGGPLSVDMQPYGCFILVLLGDSVGCCLVDSIGKKSIVVGIASVSRVRQFTTFHTWYKFCKSQTLCWRCCVLGPLLSRSD